MVADVASWNGVELDDLVLTSERLTLRPWRREDAGAVEAIMGDPGMHSFLPLPDPYTYADAEEFVTDLGARGRRDGTGLACAVVETAAQRIVGAADLRLPPEREMSAEIGYWVSVPARGNGYSAEAARALSRWATAHGVHRVELYCAVGNLASAKSALNAGFRFDAILRGKVKTPHGPADGALFSRVAGDPDEPVPPAYPPLPREGLTDGTLALRTLQPADADAVHEEAANREARRWGFDTAEPSRAVSAEKAEHAALRWLVGPIANLAMVDVATGAVAGMIQLRRSGPPGIAGIGYGVLPAFRGRGYTSRALRLVAPWAFEAAGIVRLEIGAKVGNIASQKAAIAGGFTPDGIREARLANPDGSYSDEVRFALVDRKVSR